MFFEFIDIHNEIILYSAGIGAIIAFLSRRRLKRSELYLSLVALVMSAILITKAQGFEFSVWSFSLLFVLVPLMAMAAGELRKEKESGISAFRHGLMLVGISFIVLLLIILMFPIIIYLFY